MGDDGSRFAMGYLVFGLLQGRIGLGGRAGCLLQKYKLTRHGRGAQVRSPQGQDILRLSNNRSTRTQLARNVYDMDDMKDRGVTVSTCNMLSDWKESTQKMLDHAHCPVPS